MNLYYKFSRYPRSQSDGLVSRHESIYNRYIETHSMTWRDYKSKEQKSSLYYDHIQSYSITLLFSIFLDIFVNRLQNSLSRMRYLIVMRQQQQQQQQQYTKKEIHYYQKDIGRNYSVIQIDDGNITRVPTIRRSRNSLKIYRKRKQVNLLRGFINVPPHR